MPATVHRKLIMMKLVPSFVSVKLAQILCVVYILTVTFKYAPVGLRDPSTGNIVDVNNATNTANGVILINGDYRPVVAQGTYELLCLGISRTSAFSMYPVMVLAFLTKCKAALNYLEKTPVSMFMIKNEHKLHSYCGRFIAVDVWIHTLFHLLRWQHQGNLKLLWTSAAGLSGLVAVIVAPLITLFMIFFKDKISYEIRKGLHYLFFLFAIALCFHAPPSGIPNGGFIAYVLGFSIVLYSLDKLFVIFFMTERIETSKFQVLPSGVQMTLAVSDRFQRHGEKGGFGYVCLPWINRQWHPFSLFQDPSDPASRQVFMLGVGDWTEKVHSELLRNNTSRPVWIQGPFVSPYKMARDFDKQILVSTGIGLTPALSVIEAHKESRTIFLVWSTREAEMVEFFLENYHYLDHRHGFNYIFYTGTRPLNATLLESLPRNVKITNSRPDLDVLIPDIIHASECSDVKSQDDFQTCSKCQVIQDLLDNASLLSASSLSDDMKLQVLANMTKDAGYDFLELSSHLREAEIPCPFTSPMKRLSSRSSKVSPTPPTYNVLTDASASTVLKRIHHLAQVWKPTLHASRSIKKMEHKKSLLSRWGILYCGGSTQVKGALKDIANEYEIMGFHHETFAW